LQGSLKNIKEIKKESISVEFFFNECSNRFKLKKISSQDINPEKLITERDIHRPGLALAGYFDLFTFNRIQIFGNTEIRYLNHLIAEERREKLKKFFSFSIPCIIITNNNKIPKELLEIATANDVPVFRTEYSTTRYAFLINDFLDDQFSVQIVLHGSFVDVYGVGLLFMGKSGIGKSEIVLDLVERGHRLVADDIVIGTKKAESLILGSATSLNKHFMEIRGLGIIDVQKIFGIRSIRYQKRIEVIVELEDWDRNKAYERTGLDAQIISLSGVDVEYINLPIFPGKNITVISEVIALNYLCKHYGYLAADEFKKRLEEKIEKNFQKSKTSKIETNKIDRTIEYFEHDFE
jgi:HPr kinase/phosphorylase